VPLVGSEHNAYQWPGQPPVSELRCALDRLDVLFVHGPTAREQLLALGADRGLLREGRSAIDLIDVAKPARVPARRLVYAGRLHHEKGPDLLLEALALLTDRPALYMVGSGPLEPELCARAWRLGIDSEVVFTGWRSRPAPCCETGSGRRSEAPKAMLRQAIPSIRSANSATARPRSPRGSRPASAS